VPPLICDPQTALVATSAVSFFPVWLRDVLSAVQTLAIIAIPVVIWLLTNAIEKRRATLELARTLDHPVRDHIQRLYLYRKHEEGVRANLSQTPPNPYADGTHAFLFDSVTVLNYYEAICTEILAENLDEELLYKSIKNLVVGAMDVVLVRYSARLGADQSKNYANLVRLAKKWQSRANSYNELGAIKIPTP
jgi:hypothetical protein